MCEASALLSSDTSEKVLMKTEQEEEQTLAVWVYYKIKTPYQNYEQLI